jgi:hypothetical protein
MNKLSLETADNKTGFEPGASIHVDAAWELDTEPSAVELRVMWNTHGRGTEDSWVVDTVRIDAPSRSERKQIPLTLPREPYSFFGMYVSLTWALELVVLPSKDAARVTIEIGPEGKGINISHSTGKTINSKHYKGSRYWHPWEF